MPVSYYDPGASVRLSAYADTVVWEQAAAEKTLRAIRIGGYPEMVRALADAIYGGAGIDAEINGQTVHLLSQVKRTVGSFPTTVFTRRLRCLRWTTTWTPKPGKQRRMTNRPIWNRSAKMLHLLPGKRQEKLFEELDGKPRFR
jgi:hypothetical protein